MRRYQSGVWPNLGRYHWPMIDFRRLNYRDLLSFIFKIGVYAYGASRLNQLLIKLTKPLIQHGLSIEFQRVLIVSISSEYRYLVCLAVVIFLILIPIVGFYRYLNLIGGLMGDFGALVLFGLFYTNLLDRFGWVMIICWWLGLIGQRQKDRKG